MTRLLALLWPSLRGAEVDPALLALAEPICDRLNDLSPRVEAVDRGVVLLEVTGLEALLGSERRIAARAVALARGEATARGLVPPAVRAGVGDNRWLAVLAARLARPSQPGAPAAFLALPSGAEAVRAALAPLSLDLLPADPATRARFALFGLISMGQLAKLPRSAVGAQFGPLGERLQALARGEDRRPLVPRRRPEQVSARIEFEPPAGGITEIALALRRRCTELCDALRLRRLAPGRAVARLELEDAPALRVELTFPEPALEPDWIARLLIGRLEQEARTRRLIGEVEPRIVSIWLTFDHLADPAARQLPAFQAAAGRWEELHWALERLGSRFGPGRLWRAVHERPAAALPEQRSRLTGIGPEAGP